MKHSHLGTILVFVIVLVVVFLFNRNINILYAAVAVGCIGLFVPWLSRGIHSAWMKFAELLGRVMNKVILSVVFFLFLLPMAYISRLFRKNPIRSKRDQSPTYFTERNFPYTKKSLEEPW